jgi:hypothetical protein
MIDIEKNPVVLQTDAFDKRKTVIGETGRNVLALEAVPDAQRTLAVCDFDRRSFTDAFKRTVGKGLGGKWMVPAERIELSA